MGRRSHCGRFLHGRPYEVRFLVRYPRWRYDLFLALFQGARIKVSSPEFDFDRFVAKVKDLSIDSIKGRVNEEIRRTERLSGAHVRGARKHRKSGAPEYLNLLKALDFALSTNQLPISVEPWEFRKMRPIWESLVLRKKLKREALTIFALS